MRNTFVCRVCGSNKQHLRFVAKDLNQWKTEESFSYFCCDDCGSIFLQPVPSNLGSYYAQDYPAYSVKNPKHVEDNFNYLEQSKLALVKQHIASGKLVEVGPAAGRFLSAAHHAGYDVLGIEQDVGCVEHIRKNLNLDVICTDTPANELSKLTNSCDVIVAWHVIEHLENLREFVSSASQAIRKPNGMIIMSAPNPRAWSFKVFGRYWVHLDAPRHLTLIPLQALDKLMTSYGLERVSCVFDDPVGLQLNRNGWQSSMMNLSRHKILRRPLLSGLGRIMAIAMRLLDKIPRRGAAYTVFYRLKSDAIGTPPLAD